MKNFNILEKKLKIKFKNRSLLIESMTHKSLDQKINNEKLEFLGDRVIGLVLAAMLYNMRSRLFYASIFFIPHTFA